MKDILPWYQETSDPYRNSATDLLRVWKMGYLSRTQDLVETAGNYEFRFHYNLTKKGQEYVEFLLYGGYPEYLMVNVIKIVLRQDAKRLVNLLDEMEELGQKEMFGEQSKFLLKVIEMLRKDLKAGVKMMFEHLMVRMFPG